MEEFKIENYYLCKSDLPFPSFKSLAFKQCKVLQEKVAKALGMETNIEDSLIFQSLDEKALLIKSINAEADGFNLSALIQSLNIYTANSVFLLFMNWDGFDKIDQMLLKDLSTFFIDIWYPGADDMLVFDESFSWFLLIRHYGGVKYYLITDIG